MDETQAVGHAEDSVQQCGHGHRDAHASVRAVDPQGFAEEHFLGQEAVEQRDSGHCQGGGDRQRAGHGHEPPQVAQPAHVAGAGLVVDDAGGHEQRGLEGGVVEDVEHTGHHRHRRGQAEQQGDQAQVRDRRIRQHALEVVLEDRMPRTQQQGGRTDAGDHVEEQVGAGQRRMQPRQQEHAGLHHRGRVQVGRHRGGRGHRVRQPEVQRELRALGEHPGQHQRQHPRIQFAGADRIAGGQHHVQVVAAGDAPDQQHATEQGQAATTGDGQGHARAFTRILALVPEADQQERADAGQFPEHHQQQQVAGDHHAQHRAHEQQQAAEESRRAVLAGQVIVRVHHHQRADRQHQAGEHPRQPVQAQVEVQADLRDPGVVGVRHPALQHRRSHPGQQRQAQQRRGCGHPCHLAARTSAQEHHGQRCQERQGEQGFQEGDHTWAKACCERPPSVTATCEVPCRSLSGVGGSSRFIA